MNQNLMTTGGVLCSRFAIIWSIENFKLKKFLRKVIKHRKLITEWKIKSSAFTQPDFKSIPNIRLFLLIIFNFMFVNDNVVI